jgi:hypothetical protein
MLAGYRYAQVFAPKDKDYIALEPMTAPTSAPSRATAGSGSWLRVGDSGRCSESVSMEPNDATGSRRCRVSTGATLELYDGGMME